MNKQSAHELWEGENSSLKKTFDEATRQSGTEKFIKTAIEGGWKFNHKQYDWCENINDCPELILLDPEAWKAVGKVMGWREWLCSCGKHYDKSGAIKCPKCKKLGANHSFEKYMHQMIDVIAQGGDIDTYLLDLLT